MGTFITTFLEREYSKKRSTQTALEPWELRRALSGCRYRAMLNWRHSQRPGGVSQGPAKEGGSWEQVLEAPGAVGWRRKGVLGEGQYRKTTNEDGFEWKESRKMGFQNEQCYQKL